MYAKAPYPILQRAMHIHPTVSELIPTMLGELQPLEEAADRGGCATRPVCAEPDFAGGCRIVRANERRCPNCLKSRPCGAGWR